MDNEVSLFTFRTPLNPDEFSVKDSGGDGALSDSSCDREGVKTATYQMAVNELKPASLNPFFSKSSSCFYSRQKKKQTRCPRNIASVSQSFENAISGQGAPGEQLKQQTSISRIF